MQKISPTNIYNEQLEKLSITEEKLLQRKKVFRGICTIGLSL